MDSSQTVKIVHLSSVHGDHDVRILLKECSSLASKLDNVSVNLILAGVKEREEFGVHIHSVSKYYGSRLKRMWLTVNQVFLKAISLDADIYHLHDPELLRIALKLKRRGKIVVYDAHEDLPRQIMGKSYLPLKSLLAAFFERYENYVVKRLDGVVTATPFIADRFKKVNDLTIDINNFPLESEIEFTKNDASVKENRVCFIGGISSIRGISQLVDAFENSEVRLSLAGEIESEYFNELTVKNGWRNVDALGFINRSHAVALKQKCLAGIVTFLPYPNHINAQPNKIFEYMAAGLPVIGSNFPLWKEIIEQNNCGICVDPSDSMAIAEAIHHLASNKELARKMGENGSRLVKEKYNWLQEENKLIDFYRQLMQSSCK
jgi:glycosyltransferase involved in cell wall biosynthesis